MSQCYNWEAFFPFRLQLKALSFGLSILPFHSPFSFLGLFISDERDILREDKSYSTCLPLLFTASAYPDVVWCMCQNVPKLRFCK